ncbi:MAG TPA: sigma-70 factor domain-containing protein, partial [Thermodesulfobacteriota bacterium]
MDSFKETDLRNYYRCKDLTPTLDKFLPPPKIKASEIYTNGEDSLSEVLFSSSPIIEESREELLQGEIYRDYEDDNKTGEFFSSTREFDIRKDGENSSEHDLLRFYLHEITRHAFLTREEEVQTTKEIENGKRAVAKAILSSSLMLNEVINLGEKLRKGILSVGDVANTLDDESDDVDVEEEEILFKVKRAMRSIKRICSDNEEISKKIYFAPKSRRESLRQKIKRNNEKIVVYLEKINLNGHQMDRILSVIRSYINQIEEIEKEFREVQRYEATAETKESLKKKIQIIAREAGGNVVRLRRVLKRIERGEGRTNRARRRLIESNLRLVVSVARRYINQGLP